MALIRTTSLVFFSLFCFVSGALTQASDKQFTDVLKELNRQYSSSYFNKASRFFLDENWDSTLVYSMKQLQMRPGRELSAYCHYFRGISFWQKHLPDKALEEFRKVPKHFRFYHKIILQSGNIALEKGDFQQALSYYNRVEPYLQQKKIAIDSGSLYHNIGLCHVHLGAYSLAEKYLQKAEQILRKNCDRKGLVTTYMDLGNLYYEQYRDKEAIPFFQKAYFAAQSLNDPELKQNAALNMAVVEENRNNAAQALVYRKEYESWRDSLNDQNKVWALADLEKKFALAQKQKQVDGLRTKNALKVAERNTFLYSSLLLTLLLVVGIYFYRQTIKRSAIIQLQKTELNELNAAKDRLFSIVSHDLRSSVHALKASNNNLISNLETKNFTELAQQLEHNSSIANSTYNLLDNLLHWSLLQTEQQYFHPESLHLFSVVQQVSYNYLPLMHAKQLVFEQRISKNQYVHADLESLKLVLRNLLDNGIKFTPEHGSLHVYTRNQEAELVELVIEDSGMGMNEATRLELLRETLLLSRKKHEDILGTGLGIQLCKSVVRKSGGKFDIESRENAGTKIIISLPKVSKNGKGFSSYH